VDIAERTKEDDSLKGKMDEKREREREKRERKIKK